MINSKDTRTSNRNTILICKINNTFNYSSRQSENLFFFFLQIEIREEETGSSSQHQLYIQKRKYRSWFKFLHYIYIYTQSSKVIFKVIWKWNHLNSQIYIYMLLSRGKLTERKIDIWMCTTILRQIGGTINGKKIKIKGNNKSSFLLGNKLPLQGTSVLIHNLAGFFCSIPFMGTEDIFSSFDLKKHFH